MSQSLKNELKSIETQVNEFFFWKPYLLFLQSLQKLPKLGIHFNKENQSSFTSERDLGSML